LNLDIIKQIEHYKNVLLSWTSLYYTRTMYRSNICGKDILENVEWLETNSFCLGEMIQKNYVNDGE